MDRQDFETRYAKLMARPMFSTPHHLGYDITPGWLPLIEKLVADIEALPDGHLVRATQVKEKFGGLRFYAGGVSDGAHALITAAEAASLTICQACGAPAKIASFGGWYMALCDEHAQQTRKSKGHASFPSLLDWG